MINKYPLWKNLLLILLVVFGLMYAAPNCFVEDSAVQISSSNNAALDPSLSDTVQTILQTNHLLYKTLEPQKQGILLRFNDTDTQFKAKDLLYNALGDDYTVALNLAPSTPAWLEALGATPMKLGLDLRGGIYFSLDVDIDGVIAQRTEGISKNIATTLREANVRYLDIVKQKNDVILLKFRDATVLDAARTVLTKQFRELKLLTDRSYGDTVLLAQITPDSLQTMRQAIMEQTMTTLRNRVNELGIVEATVQQQGSNRISVELPGILDSTRAKQILGGTATLEFHLADIEHDPRSAIAGFVPAGSALFNYEGRPVLLKNQVVLTGSSITNAQASFGEDGRPAVDISLGGGGESLFHRVTAQNIGKPLAIVFVESKVDTQIIDGKSTKIHRKQQRVISIATIRSALPNNFQITGLTDANESSNLALLLRAGALPAGIDIVEERTLGPKLGMENIKKGIFSVELGLAIVVIFMALYYRLFGLIADVGLVINMILLVALLSLLGMTLTLPGIAGIVLTVGMAVDANVLIFERIREELRHGLPIQASIHAGYERAFATIVDANVTTLIVALVLFGLGTGPVKGFAVTLTVGLLTSMVSGIGITRALVNAIYGGRVAKTLSIGIEAKKA